MRRRGSILFEISIAATMVAVAMIGVAQLLAVAGQQERAIAQKRLAAREAANSLELAMAIPWDQITAERLQQITLADELKQQLPGGELSFDLETSSEQPLSKRIAVDISWRDRAGQPQHLRLTGWRFRSERKT